MIGLSVHRLIRPVAEPVLLVNWLRGYRYCRRIALQLAYWSFVGLMRGRLERSRSGISGRQRQAPVGTSAPEKLSTRRPLIPRINRAADQRINIAQRINRSTETGITLIELLVAVAIVAMMLSIAYPTLSTGLDAFRLRSAVDNAGSLFQKARLEADRRQQPVQLTADPQSNQLRAIAVDSSWRETLHFEQGVRIVQPRARQNWLLFPGTPPPQVRLLLEAQTGSQRGFSINVFTGVAENWNGPG